MYQPSANTSVNNIKYMPNKFFHNLRRHCWENSVLEVGPTEYCYIYNTDRFWAPHFLNCFYSRVWTRSFLQSPIASSGDNFWFGGNFFGTKLWGVQQLGVVSLGLSHGGRFFVNRPFFYFILDELKDWGIHNLIIVFIVFSLYICISLLFLIIFIFYYFTLTLLYLWNLCCSTYP